MHIPALLPDELLGGYLQRIATLNALDGGAAVLKRMLQAPGRARGRAACPTPLELIAAASRVDKASLIRTHSLLPLCQLVTSGRTPVAYGERSRALERRHVDRLIEPGSKRCLQCAREDVQFWGLVYVRRSAQLPGVDWCAKHGMQLKQARGQALMGAGASPIEITPAEQRYIDILGALMDLNERVPMTQACLRLRDRTRELGLRQRSDQTGTGLGDLARRLMPAGWLRRHHPAQAGFQRGDYLDRVCTYRPVPFNADVYALALTVLYDTADEALTSFMRPLSLEEAERASEVQERREAGQRRNGCRKGPAASPASRVEPHHSSDESTRDAPPSFQYGRLTTDPS